jgi:signal transduction histidine kinase
VTRGEGLVSNSVGELNEDALGRMWYATPSGVGSVIPSEPPVPRIEYELMGLSAFSIGTTRDSVNWFLTNRGLILLLPSALRDSEIPPPVYVTRLEANGKPVDAGREIRLEYSQNTLLIGFTGISFRSGVPPRYRYHLTGIGATDLRPTGENSVTYGALEPGKYTFEVKAITGSGLESIQPAALTFTIIPPVWRRWWFIALVAAAGAGMLYAIARYRLSRLLAEEQLRVRIASDLHDELASNLTSIATYGSILRDSSGTPEPDPARRNELLDRITTLSRESVNSIRDIIWAIDPREETIYDLLLRLRENLLTACRAKKIALRFDEPFQIKLPDHNLAPEQRRHLWMLLKEACTNAVNHSGCTELIVRSGSSGGAVEISVRDNGHGFDPPDDGSGKGRGRGPGRGLGIMRDRAKQLNGIIAITSEPENGTTVRLRVEL